MQIRPRRLRAGEGMRRMVRETRMSPSSLIYPVFVREGKGIVEEISAMPGQYRYSLDRLGEVLDKAEKACIAGILYFGIPGEKDEVGSGAYAEDGIVQRALMLHKKHSPDLLAVSDVCLCEYTSHGHCGVLRDAAVDNDPTLNLLAKTALSHARAGADIVAPSDMMDGRVAAIREALDLNGFENTSIMSYAVKYASGFYGPFREAAGSAPQFGDRKSYQMDPHNVLEGLKEAAIDEAEGADMLIVKPALSYLDVIRAVKERTNLPLAGYSVSGEYAMIKAAAANGWIDEERVAIESAVSIYRAGADILISYYALELAQWMREGKLG